MKTIDKTQTDAIIDGLLGNNDLTASPEVWYGLHQIKELPVTEIVRCGECKHKGTKNCVANMWVAIFGTKVKDDFYCGLAERRTDGEKQSD